MKSFIVTLLFGLFLSTASLAGGGDWNEPQQQMAVPQSKIVVVPDKDDSNTAIWVAVVGATATLGAAAITVRANRKK